MILPEFENERITLTREQLHAMLYAANLMGYREAMASVNQHPIEFNDSKLIDYVTEYLKERHIITVLQFLRYKTEC